MRKSEISLEIIANLVQDKGKENQFCRHDVFVIKQILFASPENTLSLCFIQEFSKSKLIGSTVIYMENTINPFVIWTAFNLSS